MHETPNRKQLTHQLQQAIESCEGFRADVEDLVFSTGCSGIDQLLPANGLKSGMVVEWLAQNPGSAAGLIGLINCREACQQGGMLVVVDRQQNFYPPVALAWGIAQSQLLILQPTTLADHIWSLVQALESPAVTAVWTTFEQLDSKTFQRIHLAAQTGNTLCVLLRPASARGQPSWSDAQFWVKSNPHERSHVVEVLLARCRGAKSGGHTVIEIDATNGNLRETSLLESSDSLCVAPQLADPKNATGRTGA